jgi:hypothetical protein
MTTTTKPVDTLRVTANVIVSPHEVCNRNIRLKFAEACGRLAVAEVGGEE